jgi:hypothetical protein
VSSGLTLRRSEEHTGIGIGYFFSEFTQISFSYELVRIRQMRKDIYEEYLGKRIPDGNEFLNALDITDNNLFYNKVFGGWSLKITFSLSNVKD